MSPHHLSLGRRAFLARAAAAGAALLGPRPAAATLLAPGARMETRPIPSTGEPLPVIGLGTWQVFDVGASPAERAPLREVLAGLFAAGGRAIDSSPMYGRAEGVVGDLLRAMPDAPRPFVASKVWTRGRAEGERGLEASERRMASPASGGRVDLMQVHNLLDVQAHLPTLREWKARGRIRYLGITHYARSAFGDLARLIEAEKPDFVQLPYSAVTREAEARLLPLAQASGVAVIVMRPFEEGALFRQVRGKPVPPWAAEAGCASWAQLFLKFILAHPAVTLVIPATANPAHLADDVAAGRGPPLGAEHRRRLLEALST